MAMENPTFNNNNNSAGVPIPGVRKAQQSDFCSDLAEASPGGSSFQAGSTSLYSGASVWSPRSEIKMDDDDIFQVDKSDLIQGPTLAELNANDETLLEDLNFDDLLLPEENTSFFIQVTSITESIQRLSPVSQASQVATSFPPDGFYRDFGGGRSPSEVGEDSKSPPVSQNSSSSSLVQPPGGGLSPLQHKHSTLHELLLKTTPPPDQLGRSVPGLRTPSLRRTQVVSPSLTVAAQSSLGGGAAPSPSPSSRLSSSAPTHLGLDQIWQRREPRPHLLSTSSLAEATSTSSLSTGGVLSPEAHDFSYDEGFDSEDDSDHYEDFSSDADGECGGASGSLGSSRGSKKERYFWQYNVQAKGPKGQRLVLKARQEDPHFLDEVTDPVFSPQCSVQGIKHSGKARKGDGNDLTPNPRKLNAIGKELDKLNRIINDMTPVSELPFSVRPKTRKEKNKLASRACRLKKKAQHEANKIKLYGLENEHRRLMNGINQMKHLLISRVSADPPDSQEIFRLTEKVMKSATKVKIAGQTTEFVNKILEKVKLGVPNGGLEELQH
ncbi:hypothetical protein AAG570_003309 [Ranatra chinensis]|uniref:BZIP domain-containing protein n=1 Tax=Ranatra chinensis TaxID=642074 RepID=A0ABD0Y6H1_9HEMI